MRGRYYNFFERSELKYSGAKIWINFPENEFDNKLADELIKQLEPFGLGSRVTLKIVVDLKHHGHMGMYNFTGLLLQVYK